MNSINTTILHSLLHRPAICPALQGYEWRPIAVQPEIESLGNNICRTPCTNYARSRQLGSTTAVTHSGDLLLSVPKNRVRYPFATVYSPLTALLETSFNSLTAGARPQNSRSSKVSGSSPSNDISSMRSIKCCASGSTLSQNFGLSQKAYSHTCQHIDQGQGSTIKDCTRGHVDRWMLTSLSLAACVIIQSVGDFIPGLER